jgi:hypothetical protein
MQSKSRIAIADLVPADRDYEKLAHKPEMTCLGFAPRGAPAAALAALRAGAFNDAEFVDDATKRNGGPITISWRFWSRLTR